MERDTVVGLPCKLRVTTKMATYNMSAACLSGFLVYSHLVYIILHLKSPKFALFRTTMITTEILSVFWYSSVHKPKHIQSFTFVCSMHCLPLRFCLLKYKLRGKNSITNYFFWHHWNHNTILKKTILEPFKEHSVNIVPQIWCICTCLIRNLSGCLVLNV